MNNPNKRQKESRLNLIYIFLTLKNHSSATHPMTIAEIRDKANEMFSDNGTSIDLNTSTISRLLEPFRLNENFSFLTEGPATDYKDPHNLGYNIYCVAKSGDSYIPYDSLDNDNSKITRYYYCESIFSDAELRTLIDSIEVYNYFSNENIATLTNKLLNLNPQNLLTVKHYQDVSVKDSESMVLSNIEEFGQMIKDNKLAKIIYHTYGYDNEKTLQLIPRAKYPRIIRPISMMWSNGYYYLIAMFGPYPKYTPTNLRMDRILICEDPIDPTPEDFVNFNAPENISSSIYRLRHPVMYSGKEELITMLCYQTEQNGMMNAVMDTFDTLAQCRPATPEEIATHIGNNNASDSSGKWIHVQMRTTTGGVELFATQYCRNCKILSPSYLADAIKQNLETGLSFYSQK